MFQRRFLYFWKRDFPYLLHLFSFTKGTTDPLWLSNISNRIEIDIMFRNTLYL